MQPGNGWWKEIQTQVCLTPVPVPQYHPRSSNRWVLISFPLNSQGHIRVEVWLPAAGRLGTKSQAPFSSVNNSWLLDGSTPERIYFSLQSPINEAFKKCLLCVLPRSGRNSKPDYKIEASVYSLRIHCPVTTADPILCPAV